MRWTIDYENDFAFAKEIYKRLYPEKRIFLMDDILNVIAKEPALGRLNNKIARNEGYAKSLEGEAKNV